jgi:hypothetical protein
MGSGGSASVELGRQSSALLAVLLVHANSVWNRRQIGMKRLHPDQIDR